MYMNTNIHQIPPQEAVDTFVKRTNKHIELVQNNIYLWQEDDEYKHIFDELTTRAYNHDRSKFIEPELTPYIWLTWREHCILNNISFEIPKGMDQRIRDAIFYHISRNRHHPEWHHDPDNMTLVDLIEMVCDWKAIDQEYCGKELVVYADKVIGRKFLFSKNKQKLIWELIHKMEKMIGKNETNKSSCWHD